MRQNNLAFVLLFTFLCTLISAQTNTWTGTAADTDWFNSSNWSLLEVPNTTHDVSLTTSANVTINANATCQSLTLTGIAVLKVAADLTVSNDLIIGSKALIEWNSGQLQVSDILSNSGTLLLTDFTERILHATTLNNDGTLQIKDSNITRISGGSTINNSVSGSVIIDSGGEFLSNIGEATLNNLGLLQKISSTGDFGIFYLIVKTNNTGTIDVTEDQALLILGAAAELNNLEAGIIQGVGT